MTSRPRTSLFVPALIGLAVAMAALVAIVVVNRGDDATAITTLPDTTTTSGAPTTTTSTASTTTDAGVTTSGASTTVATTTTFPGGTATVTNTELSGDPGPNLTGVRVGDHDGFVRVVFDLTGDGTPMYIVGYESPPFVATSGDAVPVGGSAYLVVHLSPALRYDIDTSVPTYTGDLVLVPGYAPIEQIVFIDDFEAAMQWVIGLDAAHPFTVDVLQEPLRLVIDIAK